MTGLTESLSNFAANPQFPDIPDRAIQIIQSGFTDTIATMLAGQDEPVVHIVHGFVRDRKSSATESSVLLGAGRAASADAALINATAAHALDYDDVALRGHPSAVLVPAILAEGEYLNVSGADAIRAYLVGYEIWAELLSREPDSYHRKGWHPTSVFGAVGAAAALAHLHKLTPVQCQNALAIAASMASGLVANFGTMVKPLHAGRAASCAIEAVRLAVRGLTGAPDIFEHHAGYLAALSPTSRVDLESVASGLGTTLRILESGLSIKKYPVCYATHRVIDGVLDLARANNINADDVQEIHAQIGATQASMLRNHSPSTGLEAKFSLEFAIASALVARKVGITELTDEFVSTRAVRDAMTKIKISTVDTTCPIEPIFALNDEVAITMRNGNTLHSGEIRFARGNAMLPLKEMELKAKFLDCVPDGMQVDAAFLYGKLARLPDLASLSILADRSAGASTY